MEVRLKVSGKLSDNLCSSFQETTINDRDQNCYHYVQPEFQEYRLTLLVSQIRQFFKLDTSL